MTSGAIVRLLRAKALAMTDAYFSVIARGRSPRGNLIYTNVRLLRLRLAMTVSTRHREAVFFFCHREAVRPWRSYIGVTLM